MRKQMLVLLALCLAMGGFGAALAHGDGDLSKVKHIIIVMQENHSFDNYFGVLPYAVGTPYERGPCDPDNHACVDGLSCERHPASGAYRCRNFNRDDDGSKVFAFHSMDYCVKTDLNHEWIGTHMEINHADPNAGLQCSPNDGFVLVNDASDQPDQGGESPTDDATMSFYNEKDIRFYYDLAKKFAISDRYFSSVLGPTLPNRLYLLAATSFGHLVTSEHLPSVEQPQAFYKPITGTIFDLLDKYDVSWTNYFSDGPQGAAFRPFLTEIFTNPQHFRLFKKPAPPEYPQAVKDVLNAVPSFEEDAAAGTLPAVVFVDAASGVLPSVLRTDEHPGGNIRAGQSFVAQVVATVRQSRKTWPHSIIFITHDEHGGFYDHVPPPAAPQGDARTPDGIEPGQCADASNPVPGDGLNCTESQRIEAQFCPGFSATGPFPAHCATFNQLGVRVPFIAVSPFAKPHYVSHRVADHTSLLALIERRFLRPDPDAEDDEEQTPHLTARDAHAYTLEDLFDFNHSPSLHTRVKPSLAVPASPSDPGCSPSAGEMF